MLSIDNYRKNFLCDCGMASGLTTGDATRIEALFVSHTHMDHFSNFDSLVRNQLGLGNTLLVCGPKGIHKNVQGKLKGYLWNLIETGSLSFEVREIQDQHTIHRYRIDAPNWEIQDLGPLEGPLYQNRMFQVKFAILDHGTPSVAYLFEEETKVKVKETPYEPGPWVGILKRAFEDQDGNVKLDIPGEDIRSGELFEYLYYKQGYRLAYVMDHVASKSNHQKIKDLCKEADQLYIEAYYRDVDQDFAIRNHHSTAKASGTIARMAKVKNVYFVHHSRRYSNEIEDLIEEARAAFEDRPPKFKHRPVARFD